MKPTPSSHLFLCRDHHGNHISREKPTREQVPEGLHQHVPVQDLWAGSDILTLRSEFDNPASLKVSRPWGKPFLTPLLPLLIFWTFLRHHESLEVYFHVPQGLPQLCKSWLQDLLETASIVWKAAPHTPTCLVLSTVELPVCPHHQSVHSLREGTCVFTMFVPHIRTVPGTEKRCSVNVYWLDEDVCSQFSIEA